ncbi:hypothetical protein NDU88_003514 [Pleurodeles waltl]|uniref:Uncharacterized protein n=1 Tax=Pleurodeles waltl TaxID=8319 RepID=A0AAV7NPX6_PLEWA|nr:hypothetical protein NDU88_003514 [Pleurodeles waltl]
MVTLRTAELQYGGHVSPQDHLKRLRTSLACRIYLLHYLNQRVPRPPTFIKSRRAYRRSVREGALQRDVAQQFAWQGDVMQGLHDVKVDASRLDYDEKILEEGEVADDDS